MHFLLLMQENIYHSVDIEMEKYKLPIKVMVAEMIISIR